MNMLLKESANISIAKVYDYENMTNNFSKEDLAPHGRVVLQ